MENYPLTIDREEPTKIVTMTVSKKSITACHVDYLCWLDMAADRDAWRHTILKAANEFEEDRINA